MQETSIFLGANEVYWQGRIERERLGRETALAPYRDPKLDLLAKATPVLRPSSGAPRTHPRRQGGGVAE